MREITEFKQIDDFSGYLVKTPFFAENRVFLLGAKFNRFFIILGGGQNAQKTTILVVLEVPYTGILGKNTSKTLIPHQRFSWIFDLRIYGGSDPIYGKKVIFDQKSGKNTVFKNFSLCAKFNRFFIILGGGGPKDHRIYEEQIYGSTGNRLQTGKALGFLWIIVSIIKFIYIISFRSYLADFFLFCCFNYCKIGRKPYTATASVPRLIYYEEGLDLKNLIKNSGFF